MKKHFKILTVVLALVIILSASTVLTTADGAADPKLTGANLVYGDTISFALTVENAEGIAVYRTADAADNEYIYSSRTLETDKIGEDTTISFYVANPIAAKDIDETYYIAAVTFDDDGRVETCGEKTPLCIKSYVESLLNDVNKVPTEQQKALYNAILSYGEAANAVLQPAN